MPAVRMVDRQDVEDVAVLQHLVADPLVRDESQVTPHVGLVQLALQHTDRQRRPQHLDEVRPGDRNDLEHVAATHADRRLAEAGEHGCSLRQHLQRHPGQLVRPRADLRPEAFPSLLHDSPKITAGHPSTSAQDHTSPQDVPRRTRSAHPCVPDRSTVQALATRICT